MTLVVINKLNDNKKCFKETPQNNFKEIVSNEVQMFFISRVCKNFVKVEDISVLLYGITAKF